MREILEWVLITNFLILCCWLQWLVERASDRKY